MRASALAITVALALASSASARGQASAPAAQEPKITNVFEDTDIRKVFSEVSKQAKIAIVMDSSVKSQDISIEFNNDSLESALNKLTLAAGLLYKRKGDTILVTDGSPDAPLFREFAVTKAFYPRNQTAETIFALLPKADAPYVNVEKTTNLLSICAPGQKLDRIMDDLKQLDIPGRQIVVEALVTDVSNQKDLSTGFSWSWKKFGNSDGVLSYASATVDDLVQLKAMITDGRAKVRANPRICAIEGQNALLTVGAETFFPIITGTGIYQSTQIQRINTGVTLRIMGLIGDDGTLTLRLEPEVSDAVAQVNGFPSTTVRRASTVVRIKSGDTLVIGGLVQETEKDEVRRTPILSQIPLLGPLLFSNREKSKKRSEVIIMITPRLMQGQ